MIQWTPEQKPAYNPNELRYWDGADLLSEERRQFDICHGCRLCFNLCPSFPALFELTDAVDGDMHQLGESQFQTVENLCFQCKACYVACPYVDPHDYQMDVPRLLMRSKFVRAQKEGVKFKDKFLGNQDFLGRISSKFAPLVNLGNRTNVLRKILELFLDIHKNAQLPNYHFQTFSKWFRNSQKERDKHSVEPTGKVVFFHTCTVNYNEPDIGKACIKILEKNNIQVVVPDQECCGMPFVDAGDYSNVKKKANNNIGKLFDWVDKGYEIVTPSPSCALMLRNEYPVLSDHSDKASRISESTFEFGHYLSRLDRANKFNKEFAKGLGNVNLHVACHTRAQSVGNHSARLLGQIPDTNITAIERCSGHDGAWGVNKNYYELSLKVGGKLFNNLKENDPSLLVTDCPQSAMQINHAMGIKPVHTAIALLKAYGFSD